MLEPRRLLAATSCIDWQVFGEASLVGDQIQLGRSGRIEDGTQASGIHGAHALLAPQESYRIKIDYDLSTWDSYNSISGGDGKGFWDAFSVSVTDQPYAQIVTEDPISFDGLGFVWGGVEYGDRNLRSRTGSLSLTLPGDVDAPSYLNVVLDTATLPEADSAYPSWGNFRITVEVEDLAARSLDRLPSGDLEFHYNVCAADVEQSRFEIYYATGPERDDIVGTAIAGYSLSGSNLSYGDHAWQISAESQEGWPAAPEAATHLVAVIDPQDELEEFNEDNNAAGVGIPDIEVDFRDLTFVATNPIVAGAPFFLGGAVDAEVDTVLRNTGGAATGDFALNYYISANAVFDGDNTDILFATEQIPSIQPGGQYQANKEIPNPLHAADSRMESIYSSGSFHVFAVADYLATRPAGLVLESDEENNDAGLHGCRPETVESLMLVGQLLAGVSSGDLPVASEHLAHYLSGQGGTITHSSDSLAASQATSLISYNYGRTVSQAETYLQTAGVRSALGFYPYQPGTIVDLPDVDVPRSVLSNPYFPPWVNLDLFLAVGGTQGSYGSLTDAEVVLSVQDGRLIGDVRGDLNILLEDRYSFDSDDARKGFFNQEMRYLGLCGVAEPFDVVIETLVPTSFTVDLGEYYGLNDTEGMLPLGPVAPFNSLKFEQNPAGAVTSVTLEEQADLSTLASLRLDYYALADLPPESSEDLRFEVVLHQAGGESILASVPLADWVFESTGEEFRTSLQHLNLDLESHPVTSGFGQIELRFVSPLDLRGERTAVVVNDLLVQSHEPHLALSVLSGTVADGSFDFGPDSEGDANGEVILRNLGDAPLKVSSVLIEGDGGNAFSLREDPGPFELQPGEEFSLEVQASNLSGDPQARLVVLSNAPLDNRLELTLAVTANSAPRWDSIDRQQLLSGERALHTLLSAVDDETLPADLKYSVVESSEGTSVVEDGSILVWTSEPRRLGSYEAEVVVRVTDNGINPLSSEQTIVIDAESAHHAHGLLTASRAQVEYRVQGTAGERFLLAIDRERSRGAEFEILDPNGDPLETDHWHVTPRNGILSWEMPEDGDYTIRITGDPSDPIGYAFRMLAADSLPLVTDAQFSGETDSLIGFSGFRTSVPSESWWELVSDPAELSGWAVFDSQERMVTSSDGTASPGFPLNPSDEYRVVLFGGREATLQVQLSELSASDIVAPLSEAQTVDLQIVEGPVMVTIPVGEPQSLIYDRLGYGELQGTAELFDPLGQRIWSGAMDADGAPAYAPVAGDYTLVLSPVGVSGNLDFRVLGTAQAGNLLGGNFVTLPDETHRLVRSVTVEGNEYLHWENVLIEAYSVETGWITLPSVGEVSVFNSLNEEVWRFGLDETPDPKLLPQGTYAVTVDVVAGPGLELDIRSEVYKYQVVALNEEVVVPSPERGQAANFVFNATAGQAIRIKFGQESSPDMSWSILGEQGNTLASGWSDYEATVIAGKSEQLTFVIIQENQPYSFKLTEIAPIEKGVLPLNELVNAMIFPDNLFKYSLDVTPGTEFLLGGIGGAAEMVVVSPSGDSSQVYDSSGREFDTPEPGRYAVYVYGIDTSQAGDGIAFGIGDPFLLPLIASESGNLDVTRDAVPGGVFNLAATDRLSLEGFESGDSSNWTLISRDGLIQTPIETVDGIVFEPQYSGKYSLYRWDRGSEVPVGVIQYFIERGADEPERVLSGETVEGTIPTDSEELRFVFEASAGHRYFLRSFDSATDAFIEILDDEGRKLAEFAANKDAGFFQWDRSGEFQMVLSGAGSSYSFKLIDIEESPLINAENATIEGTLTSDDPWQWYRFHGGTSSTVLINSLAEVAGGGTLSIFAPDGQLTSIVPLGVSFETSMPEVGTYILQLNSPGDPTTPFSYAIEGTLEAPVSVLLTDLDVRERIAGNRLARFQLFASSGFETGLTLTTEDPRLRIEEGAIWLREGETLDPGEEENLHFVLHIEGDAGSGFSVSEEFEFQIEPNAFPWTNSEFAIDVDGNGAVQPLDALRVINLLNRGGLAGEGGRLPFINTYNSGLVFPDTNQDGVLSALDALRVINYLNRAASGGEGEGAHGDPTRSVEGQGAVEGQEHGVPAVGGLELPRWPETLGDESFSLESHDRFVRTQGSLPGSTAMGDSRQSGFAPEQYSAAVDLSTRSRADRIESLTEAGTIESGAVDSLMSQLEADWL